MKRCLFAVLVFGVIVLPPAAIRGQGIYIETVSPEKGEDAAALASDPTKVSKAYVKPGRHRQETAEGRTMILRLDRKIIYTLHPKEKTYSEMTLEEIKSAMDSTADVMAKQREAIRKQLAGLPEDQRKIVEQQMGKALGADPSAPKAEIAVQATGEGKEICGYDCRRYVAREGEKEILVAWATKDIPEMEAMRKDSEEMMKSLSSMGSSLGVRIAEAQQKIDGFPLETETMGVHTVTTKLERRPIPDELFEIPEGFTKTDSPLKTLRSRPDLKKVPGKKIPAGPKKPVPAVPPIPPPVPVTPPVPAPTAPARFCAECGAKVAPAARFCTECGKKTGG